MSEQISPAENSGPDTAVPSEPDRAGQPSTPDHRPGRGFAHISIAHLTMAVLVIVFLWQWMDGHRAISDMQEQLAKKIAEMDGNSKATQVLLAQDQDQIRDLSAKVAAMETRYAETQNQRVALENLYNNLSANSDEAALAEVEQMLLIAAQQLQLSANVRAALIAMQTADSRLQRMNRPALNRLRQVINNDMDKLRALHEVDITGINLRINNLISAVDRMPLAYQQQLADNQAVAPAAAPKNETAWQKVLHAIWGELRQLVLIENTETAAIPLLPPNQEFFLRENLKLSLLSARLALLSRDEVSYRQGLKTAQLWTERYFDAKSSESRLVSDELKKLAASDISIEMPDISDSLQTVRNYRLMRENEPRPSSRGQPKAGTVEHKKKPKAAQ
ncbi:MAG: uroporphyrinogen-III C-methyltransferase [Gallionella sp.]